MNASQSNKAECPVWSCFKVMSGCTFFVSCTHATFINPTSLFPANWSQSSETCRLYADHCRLPDMKWCFRWEIPLWNVSACVMITSSLSRKINHVKQKKIKSLLAFLPFFFFPNYHKADVICYNCMIGHLLQLNSNSLIHLFSLVF